MQRAGNRKACVSRLAGILDVPKRRDFSHVKEFSSLNMMKLNRIKNKSCCSSVVEHFLGKEEVGSSILLNSSKN
jgi:hypothetical protein